jgi:NAD(P)-dependent dehydrogenase (short-subunit alcohol dehydrogenase family)
VSDFAGRTAVVTGAGRGIGAATAEQLAARGAFVLACARTGDEVQAVVERIVDRGGQAVGVVADLSSLEGVETFVERARQHFERLDVLVNNVGGSRPGRLSELSDADWLDALDLNFLSAVRTTALLRPVMGEGNAAIVNVGSTSGREPDRMVAPYAAAKAALISYTKALADELASDGVRVNCVLPGIVETSAVTRIASTAARRMGRSPEEVMKAMLERHPIPLGRLGRAGEAAELITFLVSDRASFITGSAYYVDGGAHRSA